MALVKDLYDHAADDRDFLEARCQVEGGGSAALEKYRRKIIEQFFPRYGSGIEKVKLGEARKAIRDYRKATGNLAGTLELMLTYVESGTQFTCECGDMDEGFYKSLVLEKTSVELCVPGGYFVASDEKGKRQRQPLP